MQMGGTQGEPGEQGEPTQVLFHALSLTQAV